MSSCGVLKCEKSKWVSETCLIPGVNHLDAVRALEKAGFKVVRQGKHIVMSNGQRILTIPRHNPVNAFTMGGIARDAGLSVEQFRDLL
jgi:predicted RNA binding protein YcfA (HicA-like mRNA interferase family)